MKVNLLILYISVSSSSSVQATKDQVAHTLKPLAKRLNLEYIAFNETLTESRSIDRFSPRKAPAYAGRLRLEVGMENKEGLEPAPITPSDGLTFELLGGTIKKVFGEDVIVAPSAVSTISVE
jgi:Gly-Xaa carboxypeptidase